MSDAFRVKILGLGPQVLFRTNAMTRSIDPMSLSAKQFCHGEIAAIGLITDADCSRRVTRHRRSRPDRG